jgi:hypothetical protein
MHLHTSPSRNQVMSWKWVKSNLRSRITDEHLQSEIKLGTHWSDIVYDVTGDQHVTL